MRYATSRSISGELRVNLNWNQGKSGGMFHKSSAIDLDLGCLYELADGRKGVVQALAANPSGRTLVVPVETGALAGTITQALAAMASAPR